MSHVLLVEDDHALRRSLAQTLELEDIQVTQAASVTEAKDHITAAFSGIILSDIRMPGKDGFDLLAFVHGQDAELPVVLLTGESDVPTAIRAISEGAYDYLEKPCAPDHLLEVLSRALEHRALVLRSRELDQKLRQSDTAAINFPGASPVSSTLRDQLRRAANIPAHMHLHGPAGSGKKLAAHTIHSLAIDREAFFPVTLLNASDSTFRDLPITDQPCDLSLKHIDAATPYQQSQLLDLIEAHPNLRLITSSVQTLDELRTAGLSEELYFALNLLEIPLPSLAERRKDLLQVFESVLRQVVRSLDMDMPPLSDAIQREVLTRSWPDNLPELRNFARSIALGLGGTTALPRDTSLADQMDAFERMILSDTLSRTDGRAAQAAESLGLPRKTFYDKLAKHGLRPKDFKSDA